MAENFGNALQWTLGKEGGWYPGGNARDPNPTMEGVTQQTYDVYRVAKHQLTRSVHLIEPDELRDIYSGYWGPAGCDVVGPVTALTLFDMSVNAGSKWAARLLQRSLGIEDDGVIGPGTAAAAKAADDRTLALRFECQRLRYYESICQEHTQLLPNLPGWVLRVVQFAEAYLV